MNRHIVTPTNDESLNMPSLPAILHNEVVHYYVDVRGVEENNVGNKEPSHEANEEESQLPNDPHIQLSTRLVIREYRMINL